MRLWSILVSVLVILGGVTSASAQSTGELSERARSRFTLEAGFYTGGNDTFLGSERHTAIIPSLSVNADVVAITPDVSLSIDLAFRSVASIWKLGSNERTDFRAGNVYLGARVALTPLRGLRVRGGLGAVVPLLNAYHDDDFGLVSLPFTTVPIGGWDPWLVARGYVPIVLRVDGEYREDWYFFGGEAALGIGVPVLDGYDGLAVGAQLGVFGGVRPIPELAAGLRLQTAMYDQSRAGGSDPSAIGFFSMVPFVRGESTMCSPSCASSSASRTTPCTTPSERRRGASTSSSAATSTFDERSPPSAHRARIVSGRASVPENTILARAAR
ncbi:MAG: hypothetical protein K1X94_08330 [Sandaracinaceae bacterium]|nr:hypothetical protein [Sandaracinaceae bacterium]